MTEEKPPQGEGLSTNAQAPNELANNGQPTSHGSATSTGGQLTQGEQRLNPNAQPFKPRSNPPGNYGGPPPQTAIQPASGVPDLPSNLVSTLQRSCNVRGPPSQQLHQQHQSYYPSLSKTFATGVPSSTMPPVSHPYNGHQPATLPPMHMSSPPPQGMHPTHPNITGGASQIGAGGATESQQSAVCNLSPELLERIRSSPNNFAMMEIQIGLEQIVSEVHEFDTWAGAIRNKLISSDFSEEDFRLIAALIVEMAILMPGCQYTMSRLCHSLDRTIGDFALHYLLPQVEHLSNFYSTEERQNFALFLAELYGEAGGGNSGSSTLRQQLAPLLGQQLLAMLSGGEVDDMLLKSVIRALKLTGRFLEGDLGKTSMEKLFAALNRSLEDGKLSESAKGQVLSLNQLRHNSWGVTRTTPTASTGGQPSSFGLLVGPDGEQLSEEERAFLEEQTGGMSGKGRGGRMGPPSPNHSNWSDSFMDEVAEEYDLFLQETAVRAAEKALEKGSIDDDEGGGP